MALHERLAQIQDVLRLTDREMANSLHTSAGLWCKIRMGKQEMGRVFLGRLLRKYPQLKDDVIDYLIQSDGVPDEEPDQVPA